jgi:hypothetical protein
MKALWLLAASTSIQLGCGCGSLPTSSDAGLDSGTIGHSDAGSLDASGQDASALDAAMNPDAASSAADAALDAGGSLDGGGGTDAGEPPDAGIDAALPVAMPIGVDLPDLLWNYLGQSPGGVAGAQSEMSLARSHGFTYARFAATPYWPTGMTAGMGWVANPAAYWAAFDALVADAQSQGLHLVPSILWNAYLFADVAGEPLGQLFTPGSMTRSLAEQYITELVTRYQGSDVILFWEIGNEFNLLADIDVSTCTVCNGATNGCGALAPTLGTPCQRTSADDFFSCNPCRGVSTAQQDLNQFAQAIAQLIHSIDPSRQVSSGDGYPRPSAYHLSVSPCPACDWTLDTLQQYQTALANLHPTGVDLVSVHHYEGPDNERFGDTDPGGIALLATTATLAAGMGKVLFVGEYGELRSDSPTCGGQTTACGGDPTRVFTRRVLDALVEDGVAWSALWAFEFYQFCANVPTCYTVTSGENIVTSMTSHDQAYGACAGAADGASCPIGACASQVCAPVSVASYPLSASTNLTPWLTWTNCNGCTPGTFSFVSTNGGYAELTSNTLPCGTGCQFPGAYALSPSAPSQPGHALVTFVGQSSASTSIFRLIVLDGTGTEIASATAAIANGSGFQTGALWASLPAGTSALQVRLELPAPTSTLDINNIQIDWEP